MKLEFGKERVPCTGIGHRAGDRGKEAESKRHHHASCLPENPNCCPGENIKLIQQINIEILCRFRVKESQHLQKKGFSKRKGSRRLRFWPITSAIRSVRCCFFPTYRRNASRERALAKNGWITQPGLVDKRKRGNVLIRTSRPFATMVNRLRQREAERRKDDR